MYKISEHDKKKLPCVYLKNYRIVIIKNYIYAIPKSFFTPSKSWNPSVLSNDKYHYYYLSIHHDDSDFPRQIGILFD